MAVAAAVAGAGGECGGGGAGGGGGPFRGVQPILHVGAERLAPQSHVPPVRSAPPPPTPAVALLAPSTRRARARRDVVRRGDERGVHCGGRADGLLPAAHDLRRVAGGARREQFRPLHEQHRRQALALQVIAAQRQQQATSLTPLTPLNPPTAADPQDGELQRAVRHGHERTRHHHGRRGAPQRPARPSAPPPPPAPPGASSPAGAKQGGADAAGSLTTPSSTRRRPTARPLAPQPRPGHEPLQALRRRRGPLLLPLRRGRAPGVRRDAAAVQLPAAAEPDVRPPVL
eukprot:SAG11_NODE_565_length_8503_cov_20.810209_3_plen_287_part_00